jgi:glycosyltransferase involved in cell wall biosynthesis
VNNGPYAQVIKDKSEGHIKGKMIFTVLDIPEHLFPNFDLEGLKRELDTADAVCSISTYVQDQLKRHLARDSHIIYQPIKSIVKIPEPNRENNLFASVGRRYDANKHFNVGVAALQILGVESERLALVGTEWGWGQYLGILSDVNLNHVYNRVDFVLALGTIEGLNLPVLEAMAAGTIPVIHRGMTTREEFLPSSVFPEYLDVECTSESVARFIAQFMNNDERKSEFKERLYRHYVENWAEKLSGVGVAKRILEVYEGIK